MLLDVIEKKADKIALLKMREIVLNELGKSYYDDGLNIREAIEIKCDIQKFYFNDLICKRVCDRESMILYNNGFTIFDSFELGNEETENVPKTPSYIMDEKLSSIRIKSMKKVYGIKTTSQNKERVCVE